MSERPRAYRFKTPGQWQRTIMHGIDAGRDGALQPIARFGSSARRSANTAPASLVAADLAGGPMWRVDLADRHVLYRRTALDEVSTPHRLGETLAHASRWVLDPHFVWAFDCNAPIVRRFERDTLQEDHAVDLREIPWAGPTTPETIRDIAGDGRDGVWLLVEASGAGQHWWLVHLDCQGQPKAIHPVAAEVHGPLQIGVVGRGARLIVLAAHGRLLLLDAATGQLIRAVSEWNDDPCWRPRRLTTDEVNRVAILCDYRDHCGDKPSWAVFVLDGEGDAIDRATGPQEQLKLKPNDVAIAVGVLWLVADDGLWRLDSSEDSVARESESVLLTPVLFSPETGRGSGWLRAEIDVDLPRGAVVEAEAVTTRSNDIIRLASQIAADMTRSAQQRQQAIWDLFDHPSSRVFHLTAAPAAGQPVAIPLFDQPERWLWLRLKLVTPPGVTPAAIRELRVLYPDASLMRHVPAIFRGTENDPTGFLRSLVGVLETTTQGVDEKIRSIASQIDPRTAPVAWLDYVAGWLDLPWENALPADAKQRLVAAAGALLNQRGTRGGLEALLRALVGPGARIRIADLTVDHPPTRLGGACGSGARLPMLLAGPLASAPILGTRAVLGRACLGVSADPMRTLLPALRIEIDAARSVQRRVGPLLDRLLAQYLPAGIKVAVTWRLMSEALAAIDEADGDVLDANGPGRIGEDSEIGRVVLGGRRGTLDGTGLDVGFPLS
jgi:phage tail-like protein